MGWKYPLSDLDAGDAEIEILTDIVRTKWLSQGPKTAELEKNFAAYHDAKHAIAVANCTAALHLALIAHDIGPEDEVLLPSYTFVATANSVMYQNAKPVFVDVAGENDLNLDPEDLERKITPRTKAIIVVHLAGFPCDMDRVMEIAAKHGLPVIEDACHAIGANYAGRPDSKFAGKKAGTIGAIGCFSFFANKNLPCGEGGMLITDDDHLAARLRLLRSHGMSKSSWDKATKAAMDYDVVELGFNYRITEFSSAFATVQLTKLDKHNGTRRQLVAHYRENLLKVPGITIPFADRLEDSSHHVFPILLDQAESRNEFRQQLADRGIQTSVHYPPIHKFSHYCQRFPEPVELPLTEDLTAREVTLPLHPLLNEADVDEISRAVQEVLAEKKLAATS